MSRNDITGDLIATKTASDAYRSNYDLIFRKAPKATEQPVNAASENQEIETEGKSES